MDPKTSLGSQVPRAVEPVDFYIPLSANNQNSKPRSYYLFVFVVIISLFTICRCKGQEKEQPVQAGFGAPGTYYLLYDDPGGYDEQPEATDMLCLMATEAPGTPVTIMNTGTGQTFVTLTGTNLSHFDPTYDAEIELTGLEEKPGWAEAFALEVIAVKGALDSKPHPLRPLPFSGDVVAIDRQVRNSHALAKAIEMSGGDFNTSDLDNIIPDIVIVEGAGFTYLLVTYPWPEASGNGAGPGFVVLPDRSIHALSGPCTGRINAYTLGDVNYLHVNSNCCDCGTIGVIIYQLQAAEIITEYKSYGYSN